MTPSFLVYLGAPRRLSVRGFFICGCVIIGVRRLDVLIGECVMTAEAKVVSAPFELSASDREVLRGCIALKMASVTRARKAEANPSIAKLRQEEEDALAALAARFR